MEVLPSSSVSIPSLFGEYSEYKRAQARAL